MKSHRNSEIALWRFGVALMGGRVMVWIVAGAFVCGLCCAIYVVAQPLIRGDRFSLIFYLAALFASGAFLMMPLAAAQLWVQQRRHPLLHLTPGGEARLHALLWRIALLALISFVPALVLRALGNALDRNDPLAIISLANVEAYVWRGWALYLLAAGALIVYMGCGVRTPMSLMAVPIQMFSMQPNLRLWWMPLVACALLIGLPWLYRVVSGAEPSRRLRMLDDHVYLVTDSPPDERVGYVRRIRQLLARLRAFRLRRVINARTGGRATALALLSTNNSMWIISWSSTLFLAAAVAFMQPLSPSWWGGAFNLFFGLIAAFVAMPGPVMLTSVWLLPVGLGRKAMGETLVAVWMRRVRTRIAMGVVLGALILLLMHIVDPAWPALRTQLYGTRSLSEKLLWAPLSLAFALHGVAYTTFALMALSPRLLASRNLQWLPAAVFLLTPISVGGGMVLATELVIRYELTAHFALAPFAVFLALFGVVLPGAGWLLLRARRSAWQRADLAAITAGMTEWARRAQRTLAWDRDVVVNVSPSRT